MEQAVKQIIGEEDCSVIAIPDMQKGERLVLFYTGDELSPEHLQEKLSRTDLPKLWIPRQENIYRLEVLPKTGTGKVDLRKLKVMAMERIKNKGMNGYGIKRLEKAS